jgi:hypothetical protein
MNHINHWIICLSLISNQTINLNYFFILISNQITNQITLIITTQSFPYLNIMMINHQSYQPDHKHSIISQSPNRSSIKSNQHLIQWPRNFHLFSQSKLLNFLFRNIVTSDWLHNTDVFPYHWLDNIRVHMSHVTFVTFIFIVVLNKDQNYHMKDIPMVMWPWHFAIQVTHAIYRGKFTWSHDQKQKM